MKSCDNCGWMCCDVPCIGKEVVSPNAPCDLWIETLENWLEIMEECG